MNKIVIMIFCLMSFANNAKAQQLINVLLTYTGKANYKIAAGNALIILNDQGKIVQIEADASGEVVYNKNLQPQQIGNMNLVFNYEGWLSNIGTVTIMYDHTGRVDRIGELPIRYNYHQQIASIGSYTINYNANKTIDQIGQNKVYYNYSGQVFRIDPSKGLILLLLNLTK